MAFGTMEWVIIVAVVVLLFGASAIPKLARSFGRAQGEFRKAQSEFRSEVARASGTSDAVDEEQLRKTARDLGIDDVGRDAGELKRLVGERLA